MGEHRVFAVAPLGLWCGVGQHSHGLRRGLIAFAPLGNAVKQNEMEKIGIPLIGEI